MSRKVQEVLAARPTIEGAGVHLHRAFGHQEVPRLDPFLLLDDFRSENPLEYLPGFPWHPHRGIETVTYVLDGRVDHADSLGNSGTIGPGDVQWMTSGSGIIHQEMPKLGSPKDPRMGGFQLWVNLPASEKMGDPRYREVRHESVPLLEPARGVRARIVAGRAFGTEGPVREIAVDPQYLDLTLEPGTTIEHPVPEGHTAFAYLLEGRGSFDEEGRDLIDEGHLVIFERTGGPLRLRAHDRRLRLILVSGKPIGEPIAWWGPIVMTNRKELETAVEEFQNGTFIKRRGAPA